jgi:hypothetical protein
MHCTAAELHQLSQRISLQCKIYLFLLFFLCIWPLCQSSCTSPMACMQQWLKVTQP